MARRDRSRRQRRRSAGRDCPWVPVVARAGRCSAARPRRTATTWAADTGSAPSDAAPPLRPCPGFTLAPVPTPRAGRPSGAVAAPAPAAVRRALAPALDDPAPVRPPGRRRAADGRAGARRRPRRRRCRPPPSSCSPRRPRSRRSARTHVRHPGGRRRRRAARPGRRRRPVPRRQAQPTHGAGARDASLQALAGADGPRAARPRVRSVALAYDTSLFTGPRVNPHWPAELPADDVVSPITALWADEGLDPDERGARPTRPRSRRPLFATYLRRDGVEVAPARPETQGARRMRASWPRVTSRAAGRHRRAGPAGQRQRGRRGAGPPGRARRRRQGLVRRRRARRSSRPCTGLGDRPRRAR